MQITDWPYHKAKRNSFWKLSPCHFPDRNPPCLPRGNHNRFGGKKLPSQGHPSSPVSRAESASGKVQENCIKLSWYRGITLRPAYTLLPAKSVFITFIRPASILLYWIFPFLLYQYGNKIIFLLWYKKNILPVL